MFSSPITRGHDIDDRGDSKYELTTLNSNLSRLSRAENNSPPVVKVFTPTTNIVKTQKNPMMMVGHSSQNNTMLNFPKIHIQSTSREFLIQPIRNSMQLSSQRTRPPIDEVYTDKGETPLQLNPLLTKKWLNKRHQQLVESGGVSSTAPSLSIQHSIDEI